MGKNSDFWPLLFTVHIVHTYDSHHTKWEPSLMKKAANLSWQPRNSSISILTDWHHEFATKHVNKQFSLWFLPPLTIRCIIMFCLLSSHNPSLILRNIRGCLFYNFYPLLGGSNPARPFPNPFPNLNLI